jgi:tetratricopeptide (TPR) repeat protein
VPWLPFAAAELGYAYALSRRFGEGLPLLEQSTERIAGSTSVVLWIGWLGESYLLAGRMDDAARVARHALELSRNRKERGHEVRAFRLLGDVAAQRDPPDAETAEVYYRQARTLAEELSMRPLVAHCHLGLGTLYRRTGDHAKAQEHLTTAATMYREMDMTSWLEKAEAALGPPHRNSL